VRNIVSECVRQDVAELVSSFDEIGLLEGSVAHEGADTAASCPR